MSISTPEKSSEILIVELRPKLHRYCARLVGSALDGEDIVHDSVVKALEALKEHGPVASLEGWLFRIAHNTSLDLLRRRNREVKRSSDRDVDSLEDFVDEATQREIAAFSLHAFMLVPIAYRSTVILKDVLGYSMEEIGSITEMSQPAIKAALRRGRSALKELGDKVHRDQLPVLNSEMRQRLEVYTDRFNARDFDAVRDLLAEDVQLELVNKTRMRGREAVRYFSNYERLQDWTCSWNS